MVFHKVSIIGLGLIGGSIAKAIKAHLKHTKVIACDLSESTLNTALQEKAIVQGTTKIEEATDAELIIIAVPLAHFLETFQSLSPYIQSSNTIITDVASVKVPIIASAMTAWGELPPNFIPGHPIAGREHAGFKHACANLFSKHPVILTPTNQSDPALTEKLKQFWSSIGAHPMLMSPERHDRVLAGTSHLPHLLSYALMNVLAQSPLEEEIFQFAAGGLRDFSRISASDPQLWADICFANYEGLKPYLTTLATVIDEAKVALENQDKAKLVQIFQQAKEARSQFETILKDRESN